MNKSAEQIVKDYEAAFQLHSNSSEFEKFQKALAEDVKFVGRVEIFRHVFLSNDEDFERALTQAIHDMETDLRSLRRYAKAKGF